MKPICKIDEYGTKIWFLNDFYHREDGPAVEYLDGDKYWYNYGNLHRKDGPAVEFADGRKEWYYHGKYIYCKDNEEFLRIVKLMAFL